MTQAAFTILIAVVFVVAYVLGGVVDRLTRPSVWVTYHSDWSMIAPHRSQAEAFRHAVKNHAEVGRIEFGKEYGGGRYPKETT